MQLDRPEGPPDRKVAWGSDVAAQMLRRFGIPYVSLNPGASYRGLHDSLVNHLGNERPGILLCLHEDHSVAIAHGYAKATGEPMACVLHSNVGLLHGMMSLFNAWCDRVPMIVLGATGPVDAEKRRPWIDWIHTSRDQGASIRSIIKWDDQPSAPQALVESMHRAHIQTASAATRCGLNLEDLEFTAHACMIASLVNLDANEDDAVLVRAGASLEKEFIVALEAVIGVDTAEVRALAGCEGIRLVDLSLHASRLLRRMRLPFARLRKHSMRVAGSG